MARLVPMIIPLLVERVVVESWVLVTILQQASDKTQYQVVFVVVLHANHICTRLVV